MAQALCRGAWKRTPAAASRREIYPASQLGPIPRQIEGVQFGSIQAWIGPPEFLTGIDDRFEMLSAPGLFTSRPQAEKVLHDPEVTKLMFGLGANKGLIGLGFAPIGPSSIITRKPVRHLAEFKGLKIRVLASPFQLELIKRMDASPIAMTLADVVPGLQQGTIDGSLSTVTVYTTMQFHDVAKYVTEIDQPYIVSIVELSKKWYDTLPPDLQKIVMDNGKKVSDGIDPFVDEFFDNARKDLDEEGRRIHLAAGGRTERHGRQGQQHRRGSVEVKAQSQRGHQGRRRIGKAQQVVAHHLGVRGRPGSSYVIARHGRAFAKGGILSAGWR